MPPPSALSDVALMLQQMRLTRGWSREELAQKADLLPEVVEAYESNPASLTAQVALKILDALPQEPTPDGSFAEPDDPDPFQPPEGIMMEMEVRMLELEAVLRIDEGRFRAALELLVRALSMGPGREVTGQLLLTQASVLGELDREEKALAALADAERCLDPAASPMLWLRLRLEQIYFLCQRQAYREAEAHHAEAWELAQRVGRDQERWLAGTLKGWIHAGLGESSEAIATLREVREDLLGGGKVFDATAIALDLAALYASLGQEEEIQDLDRQIGTVTDSPKIPKNARLVLRTFGLVVRRGTLSLERGRRLAAEFRRAGGRLTRPYELPR